MRRICSAALVSIILLSLIFGASPALAQTERDNEEDADISTEVVSENRTTTVNKERVDVSREESSDNKITTRVVTVDTGLMEEYDRLVKMLEEAEKRGDRELAKTLLEKIQVIKEEIEKTTEEPNKPQLDTEKPTRVVPGEVTTTSATNIDKCAELKAWESKGQ
ncbi:hypothetical protein ACFLW5_02525, partial [Chloroflexota bacterium]